MGARLKIDDKVRARMVTLAERGEHIAKAQPQWSDERGRALLHESEGWIASANNILQVAFSNPMNAHRSRAAVLMGNDRVGKLAAILRAALADIDAGVIATVAEAARFEVFDDFLEHADHYLQGRRIKEAGVIAGVVFEDTIRRACEKNGIKQRGVELDQLISLLVKGDLLKTPIAKRARAAGDLRTKATHAQWDEFTVGDVEAGIKVSRELLEQLLS